MMLKQPVSFWPFVRQFILPFCVTCRAGKDDIIGIIRSTSINRDNVINMVFIQTSTTPITFSFLASILILNVFSCMLAAISSLAGLSVVLVSASLFAVRFSVSSSVCALFFAVSLIIGVRFDSILFYMSLMIFVVPVAYFVGVSYLVGLLIRFYLFTICQIVGVVYFAFALFTFCIQAIFGSPAFWKVFGRGWLQNTAGGAYFRFDNNFCLVLASLLFVLTPAFFATVIDAVFIPFVLAKKFGGSWILSAAFVAAFGGNRRRIIHDDLNCLSLSALFSCCQESKATLFSRGAITPTLGNIPIVHSFFADKQKAVMGVD